MTQARPRNQPASQGSSSRRAAQLVVESLSEAGTETLFGLPGGGANLEFIAAAQEAGIRFVLTHSESAAVIMASTYAEITGTLGACVVTRGPGITSAVNGLSHARLDRQPVIIVADCVLEVDRPRVTHQLIDNVQLGVASAKGSFTATLHDSAAGSREAIRVARSIPPGPVILSLDALARPAIAVTPLSFGSRDGAYSNQASDLARRLHGAERPLFVLGLGALPHRDALRRLLLGSGCPVLSTYKAKGIVGDGSAEAAGLLTGGTVEQPILSRADLVVGIGLDPVELIPTPWEHSERTLLLDDWDADAGGYFGDCTKATGNLGGHIGLLSSLDCSWAPDSGRRARLAARDLLLGYSSPADGALSPHDVALVAREIAPPGTVASVDAGAHMLVVMPIWDVEEPHELLISSGLATMGFSLPAAVAAATTRSNHVVCFTGDGGLSMAIGELETLARLNANVVVIVFNDSALSLIEAKQDADGQGGRDAVRYQPCDFSTIAKGFGVRAHRIASASRLRTALARALDQPGPTLLDVLIDAGSYRDVLDVTRGTTGRSGERSTGGTRDGRADR